MSTSRIRGFLLQHPKPHSIRVTGDGEPETIKPGKSFARTAETIAAKDVSLVECLDANGDILRAMDLDGQEATRSAAAPIPEGIAQDPTALLTAHFANLIHRAYEHSTEIAFNRMVDLVERMGARAEAIEQRLERAEKAYRAAIEDQIEDAFERAREQAEKREGSDALADNLATAFVSGQLQRQQQHAPPRSTTRKTNGTNGANGRTS